MRHFSNFGSIYLTGALLLLCSSLWAWQNQPDYPGIRHFSPNAGLPSSEVYDILQDRKGFIWVSTDQGVCRFDGYQFECFGKEEGLTDPVVFYLFEDHRGWIWMATFQDQFFIYKDGEIHPYAHTSQIKALKEQQAIPRSVSWIHIDSVGTFYASYSQFGVIKIDQDGTQELLNDFGHTTWSVFHLDNQVRVHLQNFSWEENFVPLNGPGNSIVDMIGEKEKILVPFKNPLGPLHIYNRFVQDYSDTLIIQSGDLLQFLSPKGMHTWFSIDYDLGCILSFLECKKSNWVLAGHSSQKGGLAIFPNKEAFQSYHSSTPPLQLLPGNTISHLFEDRNGGIWIGTDENGMYYISQPDIFFATVMDDRLKAVTGLALKSDNICFARTKGNQVYRISNDLEVVDLNSSKFPYIGASQIYYDTLQERIYRSGVLRYLEDDRWINVPGLEPAQWPLSPKIIRAMFISPSLKDPNRIYFGGTFFFQYGMRAKTGFELSDATVVRPRQRIFSILETRKGALYVGAMKGLYRYDAKLDSFYHQQQHPALQNRIQIIAEFPDSTLIVGTRYEGLIFIKDDKIRHYSKSDGLSSPYIKTIHIDANNTIWVGTNAGLNRIQYYGLDSIRNQVIMLRDGLPSNEITSIASWGQQVWVATVNGVVKVPLALPESIPPVKPIVKKVYVNGVALNFKELEGLNWRSNNLRFEVTALDYAQSGDINYRYRFRKSDLWQETSSPIINVPQLPPGNYNFEIQAMGRNQNWSTSELLPIFIQAPFWRTAWFWAAISVLIFGTLLYLISRQQSIRLKRLRQKQQLNLLESELEDLRQQAYRAQMNPHFIFNCLTAIQSFMLQEGQDRLIASDYLAKFANLIRQALRASRSKRITLQEDLQMLKNYIELEQFRFDFNFSYDLELDSRIDPYDIQIAPMLVQPFVENSIIHGFDKLPHPGVLTLRYKLEKQALCVTVQDNGHGIYQTQSRKKVKNGNYQSSGVEITQKRLRIQTTPDKFEAIQVEELKEGEKITGTLITLRVPLN